MAVFVKSVDLGSVSAAARHFGLSQAMASKHIRSLEKSLAVRLLNLTTRQLKPTEAGQGFYERCKRILSDVDEATQELSQAQAVPKGLLRVSVPLAFGELHLSKLIAKFMSTYSDIEIEAEFTDHFVNLAEEGFDLAIRIGKLPDSRLAARRIGLVPMMACASPDYIARRGQPKNPQDLARHNCLSFSGANQPGRWWFTGADGKELSVNVKGNLSTNSMQLLRAASIAGQGITFGPTFIFDPYLKSGDLQQVLNNFSSAALDIHAVFPSNRYISHKLRVFIDFLVSELEM